MPVRLTPGSAKPAGPTGRGRPRRIRSRPPGRSERLHPKTPMTRTSSAPSTSPFRFGFSWCRVSSASMRTMLPLTWTSVKDSPHWRTNHIFFTAVSHP